MPELPEVETTVRGLQPHVLGKTIQSVNVYCKKLRYPLPDLIPLLFKQKIMHLTRRAKYIIAEFKRGFLIIHLGMSGSLRLVTDSSSARKKHDHIEIQFSDKQVLRYHDPRRFGCWLWTECEPHEHFLLNNLGPEPLSAMFNKKYLWQQCQSRSTPIKTVIMDQKIIVGIGNIYACEALFIAKIHPLTPAKLLSLNDCKNLVEACKQLLRAAIRQGGTTLRDFVNGAGKPGYFKQQLRVYGRAHDNCLICQTPLQVIRLGQRSTFFCGNCQRHSQLSHSTI